MLGWVGCSKCTWVGRVAPAGYIHWYLPPVVYEASLCVYVCVCWWSVEGGNWERSLALVVQSFPLWLTNSNCITSGKQSRFSTIHTNGGRGKFDELQHGHGPTSTLVWPADWQSTAECSRTGDMYCLLELCVGWLADLINEHSGKGGSLKQAGR